MKFLIVAPRFHTNLYYRAVALQNAGHIVRVVVLNKGNSEYYEGLRPMQVKLSTFSNIIIKAFSIFNKSNLKSSFELRFQSPNKELKNIILAYNPDVILLKAYQNALAIKTLRIAKKLNIKVLMLTQTNFAHIKGSKFLFKLNIKLFKDLKVWAYITPIKSNYTVFKNFGIKNIFYLPFLYPSKIKNIKPIKETIKILCVGKFQKRKDQLLLLKVFAELINDGYKTKLCFIGELADKKYFENLKNYIEKNNLQQHVCIQTNVSYSDMVGIYKKYDLFVLPAYSEPAAYSIVEALANGLPVICSNENGTKCYIEESKNGYIFKAKSKEELKEKITNCISEIKSLQKMKKNALYSAKENHNLIDFEQNVLKITNNK